MVMEIGSQLVVGERLSITRGCKESVFHRSFACLAVRFLSLNKEFV